MLGMCKLSRLQLFAILLVTLALALGLCTFAWADNRPPKEPAKISIAVEPQSLTPGEVAHVTLQLEAKDGIKINRYPKIKLVVPQQDGLDAETTVAIGNDSPPPPEKLASGANYFETVDPLEIDLPLSTTAAKGKHEIDGKLTYFYCVTASGFCAPARVPVTISLEVN